MRIAIFLELFPRLSHTFIIHKIRTLAQKGAQVTVVSFGRPKRPDHKELIKGVSGLRVIYIPVDKGTFFRRGLVWLNLLIRALFISTRDSYQCWKMARQYDSWRVRLKVMRKLVSLVGIRSDVYHFEFGDVAAEYVDYIRSYAKPSIVSFRGADVNVYPHHWSDFGEKLKEVAKHADRIHCVSKALANKVAQWCDPQKIFINYPSIDTAFFIPGNPADRDPNLILTVGRIKWVKGLPYALLAIAQLVSDFADLRFVIVGDGPSVYREELLFLISDLGIENHVTLYGRASAQEIKNLLNRASIFLLSSLSEGLSNAVLESMAMEVPVVSTAVGGMAEAIEDGVEGFLVPSYDPTSIADKVRLLLTNEGLRTTLGKNARQRVLGDFTIQRQIQVFFDEYSRIAHSRELNLASDMRGESENVLRAKTS